MPEKPVVLLTGFEPFSGQPFNVSAEGVRLFCEGGDQGERAELSWIPQNEVRIEGRDAEKLIKLLDALDDIDDVQQVSSNADIDEEILAQAM